MNQIENVITQLEQQRAAVDRALAALREIEGTTEPAPAERRRGRPPGMKRSGGMSAEGRARIGEATRRRWAEKRAAEAATTPKGSRPTNRKRKRNISPEGRARIAEAARRMWAAKKKAAKKAA